MTSDPRDPPPPSEDDLMLAEALRMVLGDLLKEMRQSTGIAVGARNAQLRMLDQLDRLCGAVILLAPLPARVAALTETVERLAAVAEREVKGPL